MTAFVVAQTARSRTAEAKSARRAAILAAARRVLARNGLQGTTVGDIAREAQVAVGTVYLYFPSKSAILAALRDLLFDTVDGAVRAAADAGGDVLTATRARIQAAFDACGRNRDLLRLIVLSADPHSPLARELRDANRKRSGPLAELLRLGMDAGLVRRDQPELMARMISGLISHAIYESYVLGEDRQVDALQDALARMITAALAPTTQTGGRP